MATFLEKTPILREDSDVITYECQYPRKFMASILNIIKNSKGSITMQDVKEYNINQLHFMADCIYEAMPESLKKNSN